MKTTTCLLFASALFAGCASNATDIADATVAGHAYHIEREGAEPASGVSTQLVIKPMDESMKPDTVMMWVGLQDADPSTKVAGVFDPNDGDYDVDLTCPNPLPAGSMIWFDITLGGVTSTGSVAIK
ncbi:MAG: hypothetical protein QM831_45985 [Kofleriaceae bacterium]